MFSIESRPIRVSGSPELRPKKRHLPESIQPLRLITPYVHMLRYPSFRGSNTTAYGPLQREGKSEDTAMGLRYDGNSTCTSKSRYIQICAVGAYLRRHLFILGVHGKQGRGWCRSGREEQRTSTRTSTSSRVCDPSGRVAGDARGKLSRLFVRLGLYRALPRHPIDLM